mmetsp:Transcript_33563/g.47687  ORF Transcript_33563/g.47687 Transcript_33563/m.47687 type:complete len:119 (-) Transcript_33563:885-1241(-)
MSRIFLFTYVFSLPFALLNVLDSLYQEAALVFIVSYGFLGMEMICIELHDPFGNDPSDLPCHDQAKTCYDDIYLTILDTDGVLAASRLRQRMNPMKRKDDDDDNDAMKEATENDLLIG